MLFCLQNPRLRGAKTAQINRFSRKVNEKGLTLTLFVLRVLADHANNAVAANNLAIATDLLD
jgi:hypothetical protein